MSVLRVLVQGFAFSLRDGSLRKGGLFLAVILAMGACQQRNTEVARLIIVTPDAARDAIIKMPTGGSGGWYDGGTGSSEVLGSDCSQTNLQTDPMNCGTCGRVCAFPHGQAECVAGQCQLAICYPGYANLDKDLDNGCECVKNNDGVEACDGVDNDCDGEIDEDFDLRSDPDNCGACGRVCAGAHAKGACRLGECVLNCLPGYSDADGLPENGCEFICNTSNNGVEICDGKDNDCNGLVDDNPTDMGQPCGPKDCLSGIMTCIAGSPVCVGATPSSPEVCDGHDNNCDGTIDESDPNQGKACFPEGATGCDAKTGTCKGACKTGTYSCRKGSLNCDGAVTAGVEICDGKDNDCDGATDEDFDLQNDPRNCGTCGKSCAVAHGVGICRNGQCQVGACSDGWSDVDRGIINGCEIACTPDGPEVCDGKDNDCNGLTDNDDPGLVYPVVNFCRQIGECGKGPGGSKRFTEASYPVCGIASGASTPTWVCNYPTTVQLAGPNRIINQESWCDGLDNDCDGAADEFASTVLGTDCADSAAFGVCQRAGKMKCQADKTQAPACDLTGSVAGTPGDEICDGKDNDCDGLVDESWDNPAGLSPNKCAGQECKGVRDTLVHVTATGAPGGGYYIYSYEASRPDATTTNQGTSKARACSRSGSGGVLPWSSVNWTTADTACKAAGMRLCKVTRNNDSIVSDEWGFACSLGKSCSNGCYPYGDDYKSALCNGAESGQGAARPAGASSTCATSGDLDTSASGEAVFDLSGNLAEWTNDLRGTLEDGRKVHTCRGGSYSTPSFGLGCTFMATTLAQDFSFPDTGFRCCSSCAPGMADCNGTCANLGTDNANCGACGTACTAPATCRNGACK
jgi:hypothetical protein